ncbi:MAG: TrkA family potassium uptake protein, partial [Desulfobacterales bacterium]|nr:TrkA family potassium uptake protein [Desulfobacterales bacterium]
VGFREINQVGEAGRIFTIILVFCGVGFSLYVAAAVVQFMVEGRIRIILGRRRLSKKIDRLKNHYIVCGYGRIGRVLCRHLKKADIEVAVIEKSSEQVSVMEEDSVLYIADDATDENNLIKAGIKRARGLVAVLATDTDNVFLVLTARQLAPELFIMARASQRNAIIKLRAAGANKVESPYVMGAMSMANRIIRPTVTSFLDLAFARRHKEIQMEEIPVSATSELVNVELKDSGIRQKYNLIIIAIKKPDGSMQFNPSFDTMIKPDDTVVAVGEPDSLKKLSWALNPQAGVA